MATEVGIVMSLYDKVSPTLKSIAGNTKAFDKTMDDLAASLDAYDKSQSVLVTKSASLKKAMVESNQKVSDATKEWKKLKTETSKGMMDAAIQEQEKIRRELKETTAAIKTNDAAYQSAYKSAVKAADAGSKAENHADGGGLVGGLRAAGLTKMLGDSASQLLGAGFESMLGQPTATAVSGIMSGIMSGAAMGAMTGTPHGIAAGAIIGGIAGVGNAITAVGGAEDDAFKSYYNEQYQGLGARRTAEQENGSAIAGGREGTRMAFNKLLGGEDAAGEYLGQVQKLAVDTNYTYDEITGYTKKLLNSFESDDVLGMLMDLSDATAGLSLNSSDVDIFVDGLNRMKTRGTATREYLDYFDTRGLNTSEALARALQIDKSEVAGKVSKGEVTGTQAVDAILQYIKTEYGGLSLDLAGSHNAMVNNLGDTMDNIDAEYGIAYNKKADEGIGEDMEAYGGALGDAMSDMNAIIGEGKGIAENLGRKYNREAMSALVRGEATTVYGDEQAETLQGMHQQYTDLVGQYQTATEEDKAVIAEKIEALKGQAESLAETSFNAGSMMQGVKDVELDLIEAIRDNTRALGHAGYGKDYDVSQESSIGLGGHSGDFKIKGPGVSGGYQSFRRAMGQHTVPYDNFPLLAHQGEQLLTASEARARGGGGGGVLVTVTGNEFNVRQESDIYDIVNGIADEIEFRQLAGGT